MPLAFLATWAHCRLIFSQLSTSTPWVLFRQAAFHPLFPNPVALHGVTVTHMQHPALSLVEFHTTGLGPSIQPVQIPLQSLSTLKQFNNPAQLRVTCNFTEAALDPSSRSLIKISNTTGPTTEPWETPLVTICQLDLILFTTTLWPQPFIQFFTQ